MKLAGQQAPALQAISRILLGPDGHQGLSATSCAVLSECFGESINRMFDLAKEADATGPIRTGGVMGSLAMVHKAFPKKFEKLAGRLFSAEESQDGTPLCKIWEQINTEGAFTTIESQRKLVRSLVELVLDETNIPVETAVPSTFRLAPHLLVPFWPGARPGRRWPRGAG